MTCQPTERVPLVTPSSGGRFEVLQGAVSLLHESGNDGNFFPKLCEFLIATRGYRLAWIGRALQNGTVEIVSMAGPAADYARKLSVRWDGGPNGAGPAARAIANGDAVVIQSADPAFQFVAVLPFEFDDRSAGVISVYSDRDLTHDVPLLHILANVLGLRAALSTKESEAQRRFKRLQSLWTLSVLPDLEDDRFEGILREGSRALRSEHDFLGALGHFEGGHFVFDSLSPSEHDLLPLAISHPSLVLDAGKTTAWSELGLIGTPFEVAGVQYALLFHSRQPITQPFDGEDLAYVELIAAFLARGLREMAQETAVRYQAEHDALTGLINRSAFREYFERALERVRREDGRCAIIMMDLDHFKELNETRGHLAGDAVLLEVAERLRHALRGEEIISRLGGDEFAIVIRDAPTEEVIEAIAERIAHTFMQPFQIDRDEVRLTASVGIAQFPIDAGSVDLLLAHADAAMYQAKNAGRNRHHFFNESIQTQLVERRELQEAILRAIEHDELVLHYQPEVDLRTGEIMRAEALIRWPRKKGELVIPPSVLIAFAQDTGLMRAISTWVVDRAIADYPQLAKDPRFRTFVNLSSVEVSDAAFIAELRRKYSAARSSGLLLGVEITEAAALREPQRARETLSTLREDGFEIALDDFGTGYSSLSMLKTLPIDILKIDRSFINGIATDRNDAAIVRTITSFAQLLGHRTVAEGVETNEQAELLRAYGCHFAQGFLIARSMPVEQFREWSDKRDLR